MDKSEAGRHPGKTTRRDTNPAPSAMTGDCSHLTAIMVAHPRAQIIVTFRLSLKWIRVMTWFEFLHGFFRPFCVSSWHRVA